MGDESVLGVAFDGTGYGDDGAIWGGEFLLANYRDYKRLAHIKYIPLIGGSKAIREPWRMALAWLNGAGIDWTDDLAPVKYAKEIQDVTEKDHKFKFDPLIVLQNQIINKINTPLTSSAGRIFDAVASILGIRQSIEMESLIDHNEKSAYSYDLRNKGSNIPDNEMYIVDLSNVLKEILSDVRSGINSAGIAGKFHNTLALMIGDVCSFLYSKSNFGSVCLSGGVWQNVTLFTKTLQTLQDRGFKVHFHQKVPCNDGGIALGQAIVASTISRGN
jgi:hydrogenase maturation protein HypF